MHESTDGFLAETTLKDPESGFAYPVQRWLTVPEEIGQVTRHTDEVRFIKDGVMYEMEHTITLTKVHDENEPANQAKEIM